MIRVEPAVGSFALAAEALEQAYGKPFRRQQTYAWWRNRDANGFPAGEPGHNGEGRQLPLADVVNWYRRYRNEECNGERANLPEGHDDPRMGPEAAR